MSRRSERDSDFSRRTLEELYAYPHRRPAIAWGLWLFLGWAGAHRLYLGRDFSGLAMLFSGGGLLAWWLVDGAFVGRMTRTYNIEQDLRRAEGRPPMQLDGMPALGDVENPHPPEWVVRQRKRGRLRRGLALAVDLAVLLVCCLALGSIVGEVEGALEALTAVVLLAAVTAMGAGPAWLDETPALRALQRWGHRLRLYYRHNAPRPAILLIFRPIVGAITAPFSRTTRTEVRLYVELGAVFTGLFILIEVVSELVLPAIAGGQTPDLGAFVGGWIGETFTTFFLVYAFATPVGAILTRQLLLRDTHLLPRILAGSIVVALTAGLLV